MINPNAMEEENGLREMTKIERDAQRLLQQEGVSFSAALQNTAASRLLREF